MKFIIASCIALLSSAVIGQIENKSPLELSEIMKGNEFIGHQPHSVRWTRDSKTVLFEWNPENNPGDLTYGLNTSTDEVFKVEPKFYSVNTDRFVNSNKYTEHEFFSKDGGLYWYDINTKETVLLYKGASAVRNVMRVEGKMEVYFQIGNDLYNYDLVRNTMHIVLQFKKGSKPTETEPSSMTQEELDLFEFHRENEVKKKWNEAQDEIWKINANAYRVPTTVFSK